jgi:hypothetical protein
MFRRLFVLSLVIVVLSLGAVAPAQAQSCSPSCITLVLDVFCSSGGLPPNGGNQWYVGNILVNYPGGQVLLDRPYLSGGAIQGTHRIYTHTTFNAPIANYQANYWPTQGPWAYQPGSWRYGATTTGGTLVLTFGRQLSQCNTPG